MKTEKGLTAEELLIENLIEKVCVYLHDKESGICAKAIRINLPTLINQFKAEVLKDFAQWSQDEYGSYSDVEFILGEYLKSNQNNK